MEPQTEPEHSSVRGRSIEAAAVAGFLFAVLSFVALLLLNSSPDLTTSDAELSAWYSDKGNRSSLTIGLSMSVFAAVSFLWFVAVIRKRVGEREDKFFSTVFLGSGILLTGVMLAGAAAQAGPAIAVDLADGKVPHTAAIAALNGLGTGFLLIVLPRLQSVFMISTSTLTLRTGAFNRSLSYLGYVLALLMFFMPVVYQPLGLAFPVWVGILSAAMVYRRSDIIPRTQDAESSPS
jgi:hypothetical protein